MFVVFVMVLLPTDYFAVKHTPLEDNGVNLEDFFLRFLGDHTQCISALAFLPSNHP